jgi:hypothetical protein
MRVKSVVSALALTSAMFLSTGAFAQTMFNGAEVSADDLPGLQQRCTELVTASTNESLTETESVTSSSDDSDDDGTDSQSDADDNAGEANALTESVPDVNEVVNATSGIDLDSVTLEDCTEAGLGQ